MLLGSGVEYVRRTLRLLKPPSPAIRGEALMGSAKVEVQHCIRLQRAPGPSRNRLDCPDGNARAQFAASLLRDRRLSPWRGWSAYDGFAQQRAPKFMTTTKWSCRRILVEVTRAILRPRSARPERVFRREEPRKEGAILVITIDRPAKLNGFSAVMLDELSQAFTEMENDPAIRCGVLCATGKNFSAGLELSKLTERFAEGKSLFPPDETDPVNLRKLRSKPVVAAVRGICFTLGIELMLAADIVVAASDCRFAQLEVQRGIMATAGATIRMAERAGLGNALRFLLTGDEFNSETALRLGFVQEVVAPGEEGRPCDGAGGEDCGAGPACCSGHARQCPQGRI